MVCSPRRQCREEYFLSPYKHAETTEEQRTCKVIQQKLPSQACQTFSFDITYRCQLRCRHCYNRSGEQKFIAEELSDAEVISMMDDVLALGPKTVWICGGEPLLRKELLYEVISQLSAHSSSHMLTNGWALDASVAARLAACGLESVQVSLDGTCPQTHDWLRRSPGAFKRAVRAISTLRQTGIYTSVACTPCKRNLPELEGLIDLCISLGANELKFQPMRELGRAHSIHSEILSPATYHLLDKILEEKRQQAAASGLRLSRADSSTQVNRLLAGHVGEDVNVSAYGDLLLSPYLPITLGNVRRHKISEYLSCGLMDLGQQSFIAKAARLIPDASQDIQPKTQLLPEAFSGQDIDFDLFEHADMASCGQKLVRRYGL
jgi:MoaA/NifB/PqqE/SkfB family radical SAM enzyme